MKSNALSGSQEDYLEAIHRIGRRKSSVRLSDIASEMTVTLPSVHGALKTLEKRDLVRHSRYDGVELTPAGRRIAASVYTRHRVLFAFLHDRLGCDTETAERDACRMEHAVSGETLSRLLRFLQTRPDRQETGGKPS
ncbi:metal-dependent transcriptional regulator [bacterium]|nr:metal-dependent transcriptional regulator [bacterium]